MVTMRRFESGRRERALEKDVCGNRPDLLEKGFADAGRCEATAAAPAGRFAGPSE